MVATTPKRSAPPTDLIDTSGRRMRKLRISVTAGCNLRCLYCMTPDQANPVHEDLLSPSEIGILAGHLVDMGIDALRLTGGEPLMRRDIREILQTLAPLEASKGLTTNGHFLSKHAVDLARSGFDSINVSLDSLDSDNFRRLARGGSLKATLEGIAAARSEGLRVKINCVAMKGLNHHEIPAFHDLSARTGIEVRFLELMKVGPGRALHERHFLPADRIVAALEHHAGPLLELPASADATVFRRRSTSGAVLGFMASESQPFCGNCSRLRLSAKGILHPCLFKDDGIDLRGATPEEIRERTRSILPLKPRERIPEIARAMHAIGG
jgi:GTP 3',8-cyclase